MLAGNQGMIMRIIVGIILLVAAGALFWLSRAKTPEKTIVQKIDLAGDVSAERLKCQSCGATLDDNSIQLREGAIQVKCPYCGTSYQLEEKPKW